ncbi:MAG: helix-turn-helix domain-containing protein [Candidatus Pacearchaeota archaeon]
MIQDIKEETTDIPNSQKSQIITLSSNASIVEVIPPKEQIFVVRTDQLKDYPIPPLYVKRENQLIPRKTQEEDLQAFQPIIDNLIEGYQVTRIKTTPLAVMHQLTLQRKLRISDPDLEQLANSEEKVILNLVFEPEENNLYKLRIAAPVTDPERDNKIESFLEQLTTIGEILTKRKIGTPDQYYAEIRFRPKPKYQEQTFFEQQAKMKRVITNALKAGVWYTNDPDVTDYLTQQGTNLEEKTKETITQTNFDGYLGRLYEIIQEKGITREDIEGSKKTREISKIRQLVMFLLRENFQDSPTINGDHIGSYPNIGRIMGDKNHATVILACRKVKSYLNGNEFIPTGNPEEDFKKIWGLYPQQNKEDKNYLKNKKDEKQIELDLNKLYDFAYQDLKLQKQEILSDSRDENGMKARFILGFVLKNRHSLSYSDLGDLLNRSPMTLMRLSSSHGKCVFNYKGLNRDFYMHGNIPEVYLDAKSRYIEYKRKKRTSKQIPERERRVI